MNLPHIINLIRAVKKQIPLMIILLFSFQAKAYEFCTLTNTAPADFYVPIIGSGISTVGEDVPIGTVIYKTLNRTLSQNINVNCRPITVEEYEAGAKEAYVYPMLRWDVIAAPSGAAINDIFPTNTPGIGVRISMRNPNDYKLTSTFPFIAQQGDNGRLYAGLGGAISGGMSLFSHVQVELIKTGPVAAGTQQVLGTMLPVIQIYGGIRVEDTKTGAIEDEFSVLTNIHFEGAITLYTKTCQLAVPEIDIYLGRHWISHFSGPGTATPWKDFDITLKDCPPFYGYADYQLGAAGAAVDNFSTANRVAIKFNSIHGVVNNNPRLAKLENGPDSADGIGIELSERDATAPVNLDGTGGFNLRNLTVDDSATYVIPLKARYIQYDSQVRVGIANGAVVFTINYQ